MDLVVIPDHQTCPDWKTEAYIVCNPHEKKIYRNCSAYGVPPPPVHHYTQGLAPHGKPQAAAWAVGCRTPVPNRRRRVGIVRKTRRTAEPVTPKAQLRGCSPLSRLCPHVPSPSTVSLGSSSLVLVPHRPPPGTTPASPTTPSESESSAPSRPTVPPRLRAPRRRREERVRVTPMHPKLSLAARRLLCCGGAASPEDL